MINDVVNLTVYEIIADRKPVADKAIVMKQVCKGTVLDQNRVMTSASCLEINKYLLDPNRYALHFQIDFGRGVRSNITYFVSHPR